MSSQQATQQTKTQTYDLDVAHSSAQFAVRHMMIATVRGAVGIKRATVTYDPADATKTTIEAVLDPTTISTGAEQRDAHLKSADFFDVAKFPSLTFKSKKVAKAKEKGHLALTGDLTIHGVTKEVTYDVTQPTAEQKSPFGTFSVGAEAKAKINRKDFGLVWNKTLDGGGVLVSDDVNIDVNLELSRGGAAAAAKKEASAK